MKSLATKHTKKHEKKRMKCLYCGKETEGYWEEFERVDDGIKDVEEIFMQYCDERCANEDENEEEE